MGGLRSGNARLGARLLNGAGVLLLALGALIGWLLPRLPASLPTSGAARVLASASGADISGYLGADITALAVIIAVVIGFNATALQIAGQAHSLGLVRGILRSLSPFLLCWSLATAVALVYFLGAPALTIAQLWQMLAWFAAVVVLMVAYLWDLPWRLSGQYVSWWALRGLRRQPLSTWASLEGYSVLQSAVASASARGDLGTVAAITGALGDFLVAYRDARAEAENTYDRARYRALKNLLSGCAQNAGQAPNAVAYNIGWLQAGIVIQAAAIGHPTGDPERNLFTGVYAALRQSPERFNALWTGFRHALCRPTGDRPPYLLRFWLEHPAWPLDDPRRVARVADAIAAFHAGCWRELRAAWTSERADEEAADMLIDLYRYLAAHLGKAVAHERPRVRGVRLADLPLGLLDAVHAQILGAWPNGDAPARRVAVVNAYEQRRAELFAYTQPRRSSASERVLERGSVS
jgi:hypothetical protein